MLGFRPSTKDRLTRGTSSLLLALVVCLLTVTGCGKRQLSPEELAQVDELRQVATKLDEDIATPPIKILSHLVFWLQNIFELTSIVG